ncbi:hypothetical protein Cme02nite_39010 [Catellatospora methionotrophica]|uniref:DUF2855 family protein n=1 Tax=Catellatospora methionotrophica TaxID=121620 RepID=A0A8J3LC04_9ACTN|nr:hypothetical protein Cme02nite_39010 [Catellatospora methionotrophica]
MQKQRRIGYRDAVTESWTLAIARDDLSRTHLARHPVPEPADGEALLRVDRVGMTANNVTYAVLGDAYRYWDFFPAAAAGLDERWGLGPLWGFAEVVASRTDGVDVGQRVYGYLPPASHLLVRPGRVDERGFRDASPHRAHLPSPYNAYAATTGDASYEADREDLLILFRPLFVTSAMLADRLQDEGFHGAGTLALSSASSKTAYAAAFELQGKGPRLIGLTSPGNVAFTRDLGCYDAVLPYDGLGELDPAAATAYLDLAANPAVRAALRAHLGDRLVHDVAVGLTHQERATDAPAVFFAPDQLRKRTIDWGRPELDRRLAESWRRFAPVAARWVDITVSHGPDGLRDAWLGTLNGTTPPRVGHIIAV